MVMSVMAFLASHHSTSTISASVKGVPENVKRDVVSAAIWIIWAWFWILGRAGDHDHGKARHTGPARTHVEGKGSPGFVPASAAI